MFERLLNPIKSRSFFVFGPRGSGKTTFLRQFFKNKPTIWIDLLEYEVEDKYSRNPDMLTSELLAITTKTWVVIDEIQKIPKLLDIVHKIIESNQYILFALTGSSARKLKMGAANMLAGRAFMNYLYPMTYLELGVHFELNKSLCWGTMPAVYNFSSDREIISYLRTYALIYLNEEVKAEQLVRKLEPFRKFLEVASLMNGDIINFKKIADQIKVDIKTVQSYYSILEDTLIGFFLEPYHTSIRKRLIQSPKFYMCDPGVKRALDRTLTVPLLPQTYAYGKAFEHFLISQLFYLNHYYEKDYRFSYLKTSDGVELDLVIDRPGKALIIIEIKSHTYVDEHQINKLSRFKEELGKAEAYYLYDGSTVQQIKDVMVYPWREGIARILA